MVKEKDWGKKNVLFVWEKPKEQHRRRFAVQLRVRLTCNGLGRKSETELGLFYVRRPGFLVGNWGWISPRRVRCWELCQRLSSALQDMTSDSSNLKVKLKLQKYFIILVHKLFPPIKHSLIYNFSKWAEKKKHSGELSLGFLVYKHSSLLFFGKSVWWFLSLQERALTILNLILNRIKLIFPLLSLNVKNSPQNPQSHF